MSGNGNTNENPYRTASRSEKQRSFTSKVLSSVEIAFEDSTEDSATPATRGHIVWKAFKCIVFLTCLAYLLRQSSEFYRHYYTYPTNINIRLEINEKLKFPAATLCYRTRTSADEFCEIYPNLCEKPTDAKEYCQKHPQFCKKNISDLVIPKHGYYSTFSKEVTRASQQLLLFNTTDDTPPTFLKPKKRKTTVTFVQEEIDGYVKCFSENLHLYQSKKKQKSRFIDFDTLTAYEVFRYNLDLNGEESFNPWGRPQVFFAVHPPFNPINPVYEGHAIKSGFTYVVEIKLEEDRLLPHPYPTNCTDYNIIVDDSNMTKPRSQEMCKELCRSDFFKKCVGCDLGLSMHFSTEHLCFQRFQGCGNVSELELSHIRHNCLADCNSDCLKLRYPYTIVGKENERSLNGELFSYIGGLIGCWLGISVWAFTSIFEKFMRKVATMKRNYRKKKEEASTSEKEV